MCFDDIFCGFPPLPIFFINGAQIQELLARNFLLLAEHLYNIYRTSISWLCIESATYVWDFCGTTLYLAKAHFVLFSCSLIKATS